MNEQKYIVTVTQDEVIQLEVMATSEAEARRTFIEYGGRRIKSWRECERISSCRISSVVKADD